MVELLIHIDTDGAVYTSLTGSPEGIANALDYIDSTSPVWTLLNNLLDRSIAPIKGD